MPKYNDKIKVTLENTALPFGEVITNMIAMPGMGYDVKSGKIISFTVEVPLPFDPSQKIEFVRVIKDNPKAAKSMLIK